MTVPGVITTPRFPSKSFSSGLSGDSPPFTYDTIILLFTLLIRYFFRSFHFFLRYRIREDIPTPARYRMTRNRTIQPIDTTDSVPPMGLRLDYGTFGLELLSFIWIRTE